jgi:PIN domain nuclease of toxin-antitoxin system
MMRLLLDSHVAIWALVDDARLSERARELLLDEANELIVSVASLWEIAIKHSLGRGAMPFSGAAAMGYFRDAGYLLLDIRPEHAAATGDLPPHHADPFDRMLIAQARVEPMHLVTHDAMIGRYGEPVIVV